MALDLFHQEGAATGSLWIHSLIPVLDLVSLAASISLSLSGPARWHVFCYCHPYSITPDRETHFIEKKQASGLVTMAFSNGITVSAAPEAGGSGGQGKGLLAATSCTSWVDTLQ